MARVQRVRTEAGWHGRILGDNGKRVWVTEVYNDPRQVAAARGVLRGIVRRTPIEDVDERDADD